MSSFKKNVITTAVIAASCLMLPFAAADEDQRGKRRGPPPEAIEACASQAEGAACSFSGRRGDEVQGSCIVVPNNSEVIACKPEGGREGGRRSQSSL